MAWIKPVTSRSESDVEKIKRYDVIGFRNLTTQEKFEWLNELMGSFNASDANRIIGNLRYVAELLMAYSESDNSTWHMDDIFGETDSQKLLQCLSGLLLRFDLVDAPPVPDLPLNTYKKINDIEKLLLMMYEKFLSHECQTFVTSDGEQFQTSDHEDLVVQDIQRDNFVTSDGENFVCNDGQMLVMHDKI